MFELLGGLESIVPVRFQAVRDELLERLGDLGIDLSERGRGLFGSLLNLGDSAVGALGPPLPRKHVVEDQPHGVEIGSLVGNLAAELLGGHVLEGADDGTGHGVAMNLSPCRGFRNVELRLSLLDHFAGRARDPEIHDVGVAVRLGDHDVCGLEIAMDDTGVVCDDESGNHIAGDLQRLRGRNLALTLDDRGEILALDEGHGDVLDALHLAQVVNPHDVLVGHFAGQQQLALEPLIQLGGHLRIGGRLRADDLDGHDDLELGVPSLVDGAHAAEPQQLDDVISVAEVLSGLQGPRVFLLGLGWG